MLDGTRMHPSLHPLPTEADERRSK